uniref:TIR domain-containing protein n=1 Tax=Fagus sylvatica TaxID=28930 RepID=A0A2N9H7D3_FAGSY
MGLRGLEVRETWFWRRERDGFVGLRERKRGREIRWVWAAMGDGEENFAEKLGLIFISKPPHLSSSTARWKYDVFLSFRGEDTRNTFTDLIYDALITKGINTFKDDEKLEKGKAISFLFKAIEESRFAIVIFSKDYASSTWCLDELAKIVHCEKEMGMTVLPVFYDVEPSDVRKAKGTFAQAFIELEKRFKETRPLSQVIQSIVGQISRNLSYEFSEYTEGLVGINSRVAELESCLAVGLNDVRFIGIWAMGGMGILWMHDLLKEMGRYIVDQESPNEPGKRSRLWRYKDIEKILKTNKGTEAVQAIAMRSPHRLRSTYPKEKRENLWNVEGLERLDLGKTTIKELPSSVERLTSLTDLILGENVGNIEGLKELNLRGTTIKELPSSVEGLTSLTKMDLTDCKNLVSLPSTICNLKSLESLKLSQCSKFDNLPENLGNFKGLKDLYLIGAAIKRLPSSIECLTSLTILILKYCKHLVCLPSTICNLKSLRNLDLFGCSKFDSLPKNLGNIKGLEELTLSGTAIKELPSSVEGLTSLRFLTLRNCKNLVCLPSTICNLKSLRDLNLSGCSKFDNLPENLGNIKGLEQLTLSGTAIKELPSSVEGLTSLRFLTLRNCKNLVCLPSTICNLKSLRDLNLSGCSKFDNLPENLGNIKGLEQLTLSGTAIKELPSSVEGLTSLRFLTLRNCKNLVCLPSTICNLKSLRNLNLFGCSKFDNLPENLWNLKGMKRLDLSETTIKEVPSSFVLLKNLEVLFIRGCLHSLSVLNLSDCDIWAIPNDIGCLNSLKSLNLSESVREGFKNASIACVSSAVPTVWEEALSQIGANGLGQLEIEISTESMECSNNRSTLYEVLGLLHHDPDDLASEGTRNKRSHDEDDGAGPSGEGYSIEEPQPKRIQRL